ncbi:ABC transporter substrate-binding protein [Corticibacterium sp. UT-5YL-CI-8]|nr:ABC transporter substrate-binding protein [Tianweitania sp. UT-5YL-CI-8]
MSGLNHFFRAGIARTLIVAALGLMAFATAAKAESLTVVLDWAWRPHHAPFVMALEKGYYKEAGLDVKIEQGRGSNSAAILVGQGNFDLAHLNVTNAAQAIGKGVPIKVVGLYQHQTASAFIGVKGRVELKGVESLKTLKIGSTPGGSDGLGMAIFAKVTGIPQDTLNIISLEGNTKTAALLMGQVDVVSGDTYAFHALVRAGGFEPVDLRHVDLGVPLLGFGFAANAKALSEKPEAIKTFLQVTKRAYAEAIKDYTAACQLMIDKVDLTGSMEGCIDYFSGLVELSTSPESAEWGHQTPEEWQKLIAILREVGEVPAEIPVETYYTTDVQP